MRLFPLETELHLVSGVRLETNSDFFLFKTALC